jgi:hypothetical protein
LPREQLRPTAGRYSGEGGSGVGRVRIKQELDLVPERVKMEPEENLEYYYSAGAPPLHYSATRGAPSIHAFPYRQQHTPSPHRTASLPPLLSPDREPYSLSPEEDGFAAFAAVAFRGEGQSCAAGGSSSSRLEPPAVHNRFHRANLTLHLKEEAREEAEKRGGEAGESGGGGQISPPGQDPTPPEEEDEYRTQAELGSSRTVIGGLSLVSWTGTRDVVRSSVWVLTQRVEGVSP